MLIEDLSKQINAEHERAEQCARRAVQHALRAGELLRQAKGRLGHGEWLPWLREHCTVSERTAQAYMRLAREFPKLDELKAQRVADLPLRKALMLLTVPTAENYREEAERAEKAWQDLKREIDCLKLAEAEATTLVEIKSVIDTADALHLRAAELRIRAERRLGEILASMEPAIYG